MYPWNQGILHFIVQVISSIFIEEHWGKVHTQQDNCVTNHQQDDEEDLPLLQENSLLGQRMATY